MSIQELSTKQIMNRIYKNICGFEIPKKEERKIRNSKGSPVYGEINHEALNKLLEALDISKNDVLYDLGSGVGKVVLHSALKTPLKKAVGVELSASRYQGAQEALKEAKLWYPDITKRCGFINADLMTIDLKPASIIYTCSTAFSQKFMNDLSKRLAQFKHRFRLVTLQELPNERFFTPVITLKLDMSWVRKTPVHIYERVVEG